MTDYDTQVLALGPDGYWKLDEASGLTFADSSGHAHPLVSPAASVENYRIPGPSTTQIPLATDWIGANPPACATTSVGSYGVGSSFTVETWMGSVGAPSGTPGLVTKGYNVAEARPWYSLGYNSSGVPIWRFRNVAGTDFILTGFGNISDASYTQRGPWHHVVGTYTPGTADLYVDGVHQVQASVPNTGWGTGAQGLALQVLDGTLSGTWQASVAIYPGQLSAAQVLSNFNLGLQGSAFTFYQLNTTLVAQLADLSAILAAVKRTFPTT